MELCVRTKGDIEKIFTVGVTKDKKIKFKMTLFLYHFLLCYDLGMCCISGGWLSVSSGFWVILVPAASARDS